MSVIDALPGVNRKSALRMRAIRQALGMTQRDYAYFLRVAVNTVSAWENGHTKPSGLAERAVRDLCAREGLDLNTMRRFPS